MLFSWFDYFQTKPIWAIWALWRPWPWCIQKLALCRDYIDYIPNRPRLRQKGTGSCPRRVTFAVTSRFMILHFSYEELNTNVKHYEILGIKSCIAYIRSLLQFCCHGVVPWNYSQNLDLNGWFTIIWLIVFLISMISIWFRFILYLQTR